MASVLDLVYFNSLMNQLQASLCTPFIRAINYHDIPTQEIFQFEEQLQYFSKHFSSVGYEDLLYLTEGAWNSDKPGLIISFDDGYRSNFELVAPLLEKYGFTGWFFIPVKLIDISVASQPEEAARHRVFPRRPDPKDPRVFLTWDQVHELDRKHIVGCHTATHCRLRSTLTEEQLTREIIDSKQLLEEKLQHDVRVFAWVGGEEAAYSCEAAAVIRRAGYQTAFLTNNSLIRPGANLHLLDRTNIESDFPLSLVHFQLSGVLDLLYTAKRRRVAALVVN